VSALLLEVDRLGVTLPTAQGRLAALRELSFSLDRGATLGLVGESGCGKSMTALAVMGLLPEGAQVSGSIRFAGRELTGLDDAAMGALRGDRIGMVFQEPMTALNPLHRVGRQIGESLRLHRGLDGAAARAEALRLLERVQLPQARARLDAYPHQLSGGQRQRVVIAIALACGPELLIADEPTTALDTTIQREVLDLLDELRREAGMAMLLISHNLDLMAARVERLAVMYGGRIVEQGPTRELFEGPAHPYTSGLFAARPVLGLGSAARAAGRREGARLATIRGRVPALHEMPAGCAFAERCDFAIDACRAEPPAEQAVDALHAVRCIRWREAVR
jgi:peptide/nickel transport system ATP-binding protein